MAKKKQETKRRSSGPSSGTVIGICSATAIVLSVIIFFVNLILHWCGVGGGRVMSALNLIKDIALGIAVCLGAYYYSRGRKQGIRVLIIACVILYIVLAVLGFVLIS